ncbi:hypothetical protein AB4J13_01190 [Pseudomonas aeruginosa]|uniref:hypothetical protein n=1 Tax=Pseudomonas aeruginosa TaxID=287 RepID=UPI003D064570
MDLDRLYLPHWQFSEHHQRLIDAPAAAVLDAVEDLLRFDDPLVRAFLVLREAPGRLAGLLGRRNDLAGRPRFGLHEFTRLERRADQAIAYGLVGRFWRADFALERIADGEISAATTSPEWPSSCCVSVARPAPAVPCCTRKPGCSAPIAPAACASPPTGWRSARSAG